LIKQYQHIVTANPAPIINWCQEMLEDMKELIRSRNSEKDRQHNGLELEDIKEVIRSRNSEKDRQLNDQKKKENNFCRAYTWMISNPNLIFHRYFNLGSIGHMYTDDINLAKS
jgi:hypothetical protein